MRRNKIILIILILSMIALIFSGCGGTPTAPSISPEPENSFSEEFVLVQVTDPESNIIFVTGKENEDAMAILGEKDIVGEPTNITGAVYVSEQGDSFGIEAGIDGLPTYVIDSEGNTVIFESYTNSTVDVSIYDSSGSLIQDTTTINLDAEDLLELKQLYNSFYSKGQRWSGKNTADTLKWGAVVISGVACKAAIASGFLPVIGSACVAGTAISTVATITPDDTDNTLSTVISIASCLATGFNLLACAPAILSIVAWGIEHPTPLSPTPLSPGTTSAPGPTIDTLTPTLTWAEVDNADYYDLAIREYPYNTNIIYNFQEIYGSSFVVPSERLEIWKKYCWNVRAHNSNGFGNYSETLYFQIENVTSELLTITTITASAGPHGSISPSGDVIVNQGSDKSFTITPDAGYKIADVLIDGSSIGAENSYTFNNVTEDHTISATFISEVPSLVQVGTAIPWTLHSNSAIVHQINVFWNVYEGANGYKVYWKVNNGNWGLKYQGEGEVCGENDEKRQIKDLDVQLGNTYEYYVVAYGDDWETQPNFGTGPLSQFLPPIYLNSPSDQSTVSDSNITFQWTPLGGVPVGFNGPVMTELQLYDGNTNEMIWQIWLEDVTTSSMTFNQDAQAITSLMPGHTYGWRVRNYAFDQNMEDVITASEYWEFTYIEDE